ncbi:helix-turn-helix domain-containing protein [Actinacidiphila yeochonensis]|uniref:helix-turn-helix domain-containing protein n=1 Tax=Actinacidiphila yeochonensis TaxID=89050 RepID=UPI00068ABA7E|nr:helix-turn-helix transcriptional regulator [Actinacidiphila yeochonensis]
MAHWEPLADRIPVDQRRLAVQLRRMKDRSGLTVPALAARTARPEEDWWRAFAGRDLPPLAAVEVLAQASGADYDRVRALWQLAARAASGKGDRGRGRPLPEPDPLDPLASEEGLPAGRRGVALLVGVAVLAAAALVGVLLTAGQTSGRAPVGATVSGSSVSAPAAGAEGGSSGEAGKGAARATGPADPGPADADEPMSGTADAAGGIGSPSVAGPQEAAGDGSTPASDGSGAASAPPGASPGAPAGTPTTGVPAASNGSGAATPQPSRSSAPLPGAGTGASAGAGTSSPPTSGASASPSPTRRCLGLILLGVCLG